MIYNIAIIGAGPLGLGCFIEAKIANIDKLLILEKEKEPLATLRKFYKDNKRVDKEYLGKPVLDIGNITFETNSKEGTLKLFDEWIQKYEIDIKYNNDVDQIRQEDEIFTIRSSSGEYKAKFVIIAIGKMGVPNQPSYRIPMDLKARVNFNPNSIVDGEKLLIVGGGNSAVEYACDIARSGKNEVMLNYRRPEFFRINEINAKDLADCTSNGSLSTKLGIDITQVTSEERMPVAHFTDDTIIKFDRIVYAIGGSSPVDFLNNAKVEMDAKNVPIIGPVFETNIKNQFVAGDLIYKNGSSIGVCFNNAYQIIEEIEKRLYAII